MSIFGEPKPIFGVEDVRPVEIGRRLWGFGAYGFGAEKDWIVRWGALILDTAEGEVRQQVDESTFFHVNVQGDKNRIQKNMLPIVTEVKGKITVFMPWSLAPILDILKCDIEDEETGAIYSWKDVENIVSLKSAGNKINIHCRTHQHLELSAFGVPLIQMRLTTHGGSQHVYLPDQDVYVGLAHFMRRKRSYSTIWYSVMMGSRLKVFQLKFSPEFCVRRQKDGNGDELAKDSCERIQVVRGLTIDTTNTYFVVTYTVMDCDSRVAMIPIVNVLDSLIPIVADAREL